MKPYLLRLFFLVMVATTLSATSFAAENQSVTQRAETEESFAAAEAAYSSGDLSLALSNFRRFVLSYHDSVLVPRAYAYLGRIFLKQRRYTDALLYLERIDKSARTAEVQLLVGYSLILSGENESGFAQLQPIINQPFSPEDQQYLYEGMALVDGRRGEFLRALYFYRQALPGTSNRRALLKAVHQLLQTTDTSVLAEAAFMFHDGPIGQDARLRLARKALDDRDQQRALRYLKQILASQVSFPWRDDAAKLMDRFSQGGWLQHDAIGVLLPLTGRYKTFGNLVKRGIDLALKQHNIEKTPLKVLYRDTEGDSVKARKEAASLANEQRVMAILGPLTSSAAIAAAAGAQQNEIPLLALSRRASIPDVGPFIFRNSLTSRLQMRALARYAVQQKGLHSFGILAPENRLGRELTELFSEEVIRLGGLVIEVQTYPQDATDYRAQILHLMGKSAARKKEDYQKKSEAKILNDLFIPDPPDYPSTTFDALFLPDSADRIGQIAPQLAFYGIKNTPLLGINYWNSPDLLHLAGRYVEGAVFIDGFFLDSPYPFVKKFIDLYVDAYGEEPSILEAQAFDSANILFNQLNNPAVSDRASLREAIGNVQNYPGVTGATSFDFTGEAVKVLFQLQVKDGQIVQIN